MTLLNFTEHEMLQAHGGVTRRTSDSLTEAHGPQRAVLYGCVDVLKEWFLKYFIFYLTNTLFWANPECCLLAREG